MTENLWREGDELVWSGLLQAVELDENMNVVSGPPAGDYLFRGTRYDPLFWDISAEMIQLNDYCVLCLQQTAILLENMQGELRDLKTGKAHVETPLGDFTEEMIMSIEEKIPVWNDTNQFLSRAMCLILLSAFTEKTLNTICIARAPKGAERPRPQPGESKIDAYLRHLQNVCKLQFFEPEETSCIRDKCRKIRNAFAHGDWEEVRRRSADIHLRDAFLSISILLEAIEEQVEISDEGKR
ncbi:MAG: hypothetical protein M3R24_18150 [Chloroflexota bacterium]|nr:hypothetical protein [Chloroflexota bacterium]